MSLATPIQIRTLQRTLYLKAKAEPVYRFYLLYDKIYREDILAHAYQLAKANAGAPGVDGQTFREIESKGVEEWLAGIRNEIEPAARRGHMQPLQLPAHFPAGLVHAVGQAFTRRRPQARSSGYAEIKHGK